jgi:hypothetical protein
MNWWKPEDIREIDFNRSFRVIMKRKYEIF